MDINEIRRKIISPLVIFSTLAFGCVGAIIAYEYFVTYKSRAVVLFEKNISDFRTLEKSVATVKVLERYLGSEKVLQATDKEEVNYIKNEIVNSEKWITPIFRFNKKDAQQISAQIPAGLSDVLGYEIVSFSKYPELARRRVEFLMNYVLDASLKIQLDNAIDNALTAKKLLLTSAALEKKVEHENIAFLQEKLIDLRRLSKLYPSSSSSVSFERQTFSVENEERYMPLPLQMIAVEREIFDIKEKLAKMQRRVNGLPEEEAMLLAHEKLSKNINSGKETAIALMEDINRRKLNVKQDYDMTSLLEYEDKYSVIANKHLNSSRIIVAPTPPSVSVSSPYVIAILFGLLGGLFALGWQFRNSIAQFLKDGNIAKTDN